MPGFSSRAVWQVLTKNRASARAAVSNEMMGELKFGWIIKTCDNRGYQCLFTNIAQASRILIRGTKDNAIFEVSGVARVTDSQAIIKLHSTLVLGVRSQSIV